MDRRFYQRILCCVECILISTDDDSIPYEIEGMIVDMSESGLKISFDKSKSTDSLTHLKINDPIHFQAYDEYEVLGEQKDTIISGDAAITRIIDVGDTIEIGCKYTTLNSELDEYIMDRKVSSFVNGMHL